MVRTKQFVLKNFLIGLKKIRVKPSTRFLKNKKISMSNNIYFPMTIRNEEDIYDSFTYIINSSNYCLNGIKIKKASNIC